MTCAVAPNWHPFSTPYEWSPMNSVDNASMASGYESKHQGYASSESESRQASSSSGKKRASRAGTRSVTTLSAAQLERKRANDREAQRAIRQRTKDHIESLERSISDLRASHDASERLVAATNQRNRELEEENAFLRTKLNEAGYPVAASQSEGQPAPDQGLVSVHSASPVAQASATSIHRPDSASTPRSALSMTTSHSSTSRSNSWQQNHNGYGLTAPSVPPSLPTTTSVQLTPNLTAWRPHDMVQVHSNPAQGQDSAQAPPQTAYGPPNPTERTQWSTPQQFQYQDQQSGQPNPSQTPQPQQQYGQTSLPAYGTSATPQQATYHQPPQTEFQGMTVQSPPGYPVTAQQGYEQPSQYHMTPMQVSPHPGGADYAAQQSHMHAPPVAAAGYHNGPPEHQYSQQHVQPGMQYREDQSGRAYSLTHYPSG